MATIEIARVGDSSDLSALKRNFARVLQDRFGPKPKPMTFDQAIASRGIDAKRAIRNMRRRANYHQSLDRPKFFSDANIADLYIGYWKNGKCYTAEVASQDLVTLKHTADTAAYVGAWCRLNHLIA